MHFGDPPNIDSQLLVDYPIGPLGVQEPIRIYRVHLDVAITPKTKDASDDGRWEELRKALSADDMATVHKIVLDNVDLASQTTAIMELLTQALKPRGAQTSTMGDSPNVDRMTIEDSAYPAVRMAKHRRIFRIHMDFLIEEGWEVLVQAMQSKMTGAAYEVVKKNIEKAHSSIETQHPHVLPILQAALHHKP